MFILLQTICHFRGLVGAFNLQVHVTISSNIVFQRERGGRTNVLERALYKPEAISAQDQHLTGEPNPNVVAI